MASNSGGAAPQNQATPAVTRSSTRVALALTTTNSLRGLQQLCLYTNTALLNMAHHMKLLTYAEYACSAYQRAATASEGEKVLQILNNFKEAGALREAALWKGATCSTTKQVWVRQHSAR